MQRINFFILMIILLFPMTIGAVPQLLQHQGYMSNNQGIPATGSANLTFNLYTVESEGSSVWTQTMPVTFDAGYYSVDLGPGTPELSITLFNGSDLYLGVTLEGQDEFLPRMPITSVPYAFRSGAVEGEVKAVGGLVVDGVEVINDQQQWAGNNISFNDLADVPSEWADGDDVGLEGSGTDGALAQFAESGLGDSAIVESDGKIGVGTADPQSTVHVAGGVQIQDDSGDCVEGKEGTLRWHESNIEVCDGIGWMTINSPPLSEVLPFDSAGTTSWTAPSGVTSVSVLIVAGGGGGGGRSGAGGGAGGYIYEESVSVTPGDSYDVVVGAGGAGGAGGGVVGNNGANSSVFGLTAIGGGGGGSDSQQTGSNGGSGGGGRYGENGGNGTSGQGNNGGFGTSGTWNAGGGGGAGGAGVDGTSSACGNGGVGVQNDISGEAVWYAGGGGGGSHDPAGGRGLGGNGGGGHGGTPGGKNAGDNGVNGTGGGGGGGTTNSSSGGAGGTGGSGVVIIKH